MKIKKIMCALLSLCITASLTLASADGEYEQKVKLTKTMYTPKTIYVDDDFNDRTDGECVANSDYEKKIPKAASGAIAESEDGNTYVNLSKKWASAKVTILNNGDIESDKLAVSFKFRHNTGTNSPYFQIRFDGANPMFLFQTFGSNGVIGMNKDASSGKKNIWYYDIPCTEWIQFDMILEKVSVGGEYKARFAEAYLNDEALDMRKVTSELGSDILYCGDWWSGNITEDAINISQVSFTDESIDVDDIMLYEPYDFSINSAEYTEDANEIRIAMTQGIDEQTMENIKLVGEEKTIECAKKLDMSDETKRTILVTPSESLDLENEAYYVVIDSIKSLGGAAVTSEKFLIADRYLSLSNVSAVKSENDVTAMFDVNEFSGDEPYAVVSVWKGENCIDFALKKITADDTSVEVTVGGDMADADRVQVFLIDSPEGMRLISDVWETEF